jgi:HEAT repeat protein
MHDPEPEVRLAAAFDLGTLGDPDAVHTLLQALTAPDDDVVCVASESLLRLSGKRKPDMKKLTDLLHNSRPVVRERAVYLISNLGDDKAMRQVLTAAYKEENAAVIQMIAEALKNFDAEEALPVLDLLLKKSVKKSIETAEECIKSVKFFGKKGVCRLIPYLSASNPAIKNAVIKALKDVSGRDYGDNVTKWQSWAKR